MQFISHCQLHANGEKEGTGDPASRWIPFVLRAAVALYNRRRGVMAGSQYQFRIWGLESAWDGGCNDLWR